MPYYADMAMKNKKTQTTEWKFEWINKDGDIIEVDLYQKLSEVKKQIKLIEKVIEENDGSPWIDSEDDAVQLDIVKERRFYEDYGNNDGHLIDIDILETTTINLKKEEKK